MKGPIPSFEYDATKYKHIVMIAGGTGIAPMYQICTSTAKNKGEPTTKLILIDANRTEEDILLRRELETLAADLKNRFDLHYILSKVN
jgi:cytochrome-b5 reductase